MYYFAYGMNTNLDHMTTRCPGASVIGAAKLVDHKFRFAYHADIMPEDNSTVDGVLWLITKECLISLDLLEGYPRYYNRKIVDIEYKNQHYFSWVYYMNGGRDELPAKSYWDCVLEGYTQNNVPTEQLYTAINSNLSVESLT